MLWTVQLVHASYVGFVVAAPLLVLHAGLARARWLVPLRWAHLLTLAFIAVQYTLGWACPLTQLENTLAGRPADTELLAALAPHTAVIATVVVVYLIASLVAHMIAWRPARVRLEPS